ncbi:APC family permease [Paraburkholderia caballeronis]|uniref:Amino acid efflux transporter n=1 Tax=Paraburkholderia caballeronis TaxID=416943 RepID=A0A1H7U2G7_9BURK|nr:APC family permease [Paraburkholderia caballeronis]PXW23460.1 amino acid efflux transporter [Paraburkholderia caballeronis]PXW98453.1 amino acid efflux transporter [Paraburkholderia caballeronis]RAJ95184.1 amino acid efflux transporter [Paraburkholderia caballeronis]SEC52178.1 amino acid efflux transporter [Paraburkholderia caballeronis]SEL90856.1 amino acid efflux transporter [Paraburkholderia caballeronis]
MRDDRKKIGAVVATAMSVTIVVGAGLLALAGLSYAYAGRLGYLPWLLVAAAMLPLLEIFSYFGRTHPSAGGVVGYVRASLGPRAATVAETIVLGTFTLGIPAISLIGAGYLRQVAGAVSVTEGALGVVTVAFVAGIVGLRVSGAIQTAIAVSIVGGLMTVGVGFLCSAHPPPAAAVALEDAAAWHGVLRAVPVILFAFTGWELTAFLAEDMRDPRRDLPTSIWASFVIVTALYLFIAWIVATYALPDDRWKVAPVAQLANEWLGAAGRGWVGAIGALLVVANVVAAFVSVSRAIFAAGRDGLLPRFVGRLDRRGAPTRAMLLTYAVFVAVIAAAGLGAVRIDTLLQLAGQNFFVLYLLAVVGYVSIHRGGARRWIGYVAAVAVLGMMSLFSVEGLVYCGGLAALGLWLGRPVRTAACAD